MGSLSLLQGDLPNPGIEPRSPALQAVVYQLSHKGSPRILEWVACPFSRASSGPRNQTGGLLHCRRTLYQLSHRGSPKWELEGAAKKKKKPSKNQSVKDTRVHRAPSSEKAECEACGENETGRGCPDARVALSPSPLFMVLLICVCPCVHEIGCH